VLLNVAKDAPSCLLPHLKALSASIEQLWAAGQLREGEKVWLWLQCACAGLNLALLVCACRSVCVCVTLWYTGASDVRVRGLNQ
jgi:hypothetical protein